MLRELVVLRALPSAPAPQRAPWERPAPDFATAVQKAQLWLDAFYRGQVVLGRPTAHDETRRGWVFSCNSRRFLGGGAWQDAMLDATVVVPKDDTAPFGLPNSDPWAWFHRWDNGENFGTPTMPPPPAPGHPSWFEPTLAQLGPVLSVSEHADWPTTMNAVSVLPIGARALVWIRRTDGRGREAVGLLVNAVRLQDRVVVIDGSSDKPFAFDPTSVHRLHVIRYR
ncbi:YrhB family protein [Streptomyces thermoviolaceus]|uniref:Immunity protein 35 domain-containing protein n=1 Tax=Streptomyces thermoviolaceus subsp. thermoviolaceus TaxID=66860 RepID=A0ABX0YTF6_STRTL|nr:YrhB family protein [Streptomyces thermoviolaceus]NJP14556.1 hypothetical protein [Streptomyces thermoviolaceus subsp. thermoviolaceus]WTD47898.1 YrhB family protein [Streptomyces thermoviolaceus]GGV74442.1 hypothetical protein GCM10010499_29090 [Streptomyces thermoviolaceus subsp. apingens]GHA94318.1 hypothetical protein GCM10010512_27340 [Streptomyces thermoviolaceus subsp. thermoviolaceus]